MPIYGYRCSACGHEFEILQKMSEKPLTACPKCGGKLNKLMYPVGISFKGSGFYTTDYKSGASAGSASSNGASGASESGSETKTTETKTETKPESKSDSKSESKSKSNPESKSEKAS
jgi:putative FmdB family regulatory protein